MSVSLQPVRVSDIEEMLTSHLMELLSSRNEARLLSYLMLRGESAGTTVAHDLRIDRTGLHDYLMKLAARGFVFSTFTKPQLYYAVSYGELIDLLTEQETAAARSTAERCKNAFLQYFLNNLRRANSLFL